MLIPGATHGGRRDTSSKEAAVGKKSAMNKTEAAIVCSASARKTACPGSVCPRIDRSAGRKPTIGSISRSRERVGFLQPTPQGDLVIVYLESPGSGGGVCGVGRLPEGVRGLVPRLCSGSDRHGSDDASAFQPAHPDPPPCPRSGPTDAESDSFSVDGEGGMNPWGPRFCNKKEGKGMGMEQATEQTAKKMPTDRANG